MTDYFHGIRIHYDRSLRRPRLERYRFSGGVNLSAQARNAALLADASKFYVVKPYTDSLGRRTSEMLVFPYWMRAQVEAQLQKVHQESEPIRVVPATLDDMRSAEVAHMVEEERRRRLQFAADRILAARRPP